MNNTKMLFEAFEFAFKAHKGQLRKATTVPYIVHPVGVSAILGELGCDQIILASAVLHDTLEDTPATKAQLEELFGAEVARIVEGCSEIDKNLSWEQRKQQTLDFLSHQADEKILTVACADKLDNARNITRGVENNGENFWNIFNRPREKQFWYFDNLCKILTKRLKTYPGSKIAADFAQELEKLHKISP